VKRGLVAAALLAGAGACATASLPATPRTGAYSDYLVARIANARADHAAAADSYFSALARAPGDAALVEGAVIASLAAGDIGRARRAARLSAPERAPAYANIVRAAEALAARDWRGAERRLALVEGAAGEELVARMLAVWVRVGAGGSEDGAVDLLSLTAIRPYGALFGYQHAMALDYAGQQEEALTAYAAARRGGMALPLGVEAHADLLARRGQRAEAAALLGADRADAVLTSALARLEAGGRPAERPLTPARGAAIGLTGLAAIFQREGDATGALAVLTLARSMAPELDAAHLAYGQMQTDLGHFESARAAFAGIAATSPHAAAARSAEVWALLDTGDAAGALTLARAHAEGGEIQAQRTLAALHSAQGRYSEAEPLYTALIERAPQDWRLPFARGLAREKLGRWPEAEADLRQALELSPDQPDVLNSLGYALADRGERLEEALAMLERAVELRPMSGAVIDSLGWAHYRLGNYARALDVLEHAVALEPGHATLNDHLGDAYWRVGRRTEARFQWRRALGQGPEDAAAIQAKLDHGLPEPASPP
jgi:tetratricopeptide (TPR) repeat protein